MQKIIKKAIGFCLLILIVVFLFYYIYFSADKIIGTIFLIEKLPRNQKAEGYLYLRNAGVDYIQRGFLSRFEFNSKHDPGVWIWTLNGLRFVKNDESSIYSYFSICEGDKWKENNTSIKKNVNMNYYDWEKKMRKGDFTEIVIGNNGYIKEITGYDWWVFTPMSHSYFEVVCKKR